MRTNEPMSIDQIRKYAPAVFATERHPDRTSDQYTFLSTEEVLHGMLDAGFGVFRAQQKYTRNAEDMMYTRHLLAFRPLDRTVEVGDSIVEALLISAHDGLCSYNLSAGLFRLICSNGMVVGQNFATIHVAHRGDIIEQVREGSEKVLEFAPKLHEFQERCLATELTEARQHDYATQAMRIRHSGETPYLPDALLQVRRPQDAGDDLWHVFQRVQENLMNGGITGSTTTGRRSVSRPINRVTKDVIYNRALWDVTEEYLEAA